jgi:hypothetical protein
MIGYLFKDVGGILIIVAAISGLAALVFPAATPSPKVNRAAYLQGKSAALFWGSASFGLLLILLIGYIGYEARNSMTHLRTSEDGQKIKTAICAKYPGCTSVGDPYLAYNQTTHNWYVTFDVMVYGATMSASEVFEGDWKAEVETMIQSLPMIVQLLIDESGSLRVTTKLTPRKGRK